MISSLRPLIEWEKEKHQLRVLRCKLYYWFTCPLIDFIATDDQQPLHFFVILIFGSPQYLSPFSLPDTRPYRMLRIAVFKCFSVLNLLMQQHVTVISVGSLLSFLHPGVPSVFDI